jgi:23S rRNA pseudouridine1911/1915/1917 synthase
MTQSTPPGTGPTAGSPNIWAAPEAGRLQALVRVALDLTHSRARDAISTGKVRVDGVLVRDPGAAVKAGQRLQFVENAPRPERVEPFGVRTVYIDDDILVIDKPSGLLSAPVPTSSDSEAPEKSALHAAQQLCKGPRRPKVVHRLDKLTSGLMVLARSVESARVLRAALDEHSVRRGYRCVVEGRPPEPSALISSMLIRDRGDGKRGSRMGTFRLRPMESPSPGPMPGGGKVAVTRYETAHAVHGRTALEVRLDTGRTHQIRIHLAELGCPILGEAVYVEQGRGSVPGAVRQALHAAILELVHPINGKTLRFESPWPADLADVTPRGAHW